jgi:hypothetical protein
MRTVSGLVALVGIMAAAVPLEGQGGAISAGTAARRGILVGGPADARKGLWLGAGLGTGAGSLHCSICNHESEQGTSGYLRAGTTINRKMLLGVEGGAWQRSGDEGKRRLLTLTGGAWWYPTERHGYFLRFGAGVSRWRAWKDGDAVTSQAVALVVGTGYEVRVNPGLSVVPYLNALGTSSGALWLESKDAVSFERRKLPAGGHALLFQLGLGITRH